MSSRNGIITGSVIFATLAIGGFFYYTSQNPKSDAEKHIEQVKQNPDSNLIYNPKNPNFLTFGGSTRRHKKGNKHTKKRAKH